MLLPSKNLHTTCNEKVHILSRGVYNSNSGGPDFEEARLKIGDIEWVGSVEIHVKSSDWLKHGHSADPLYKNVILHVVFTHDLPEDHEVSSIPTIRVSEYVSEKFIALLGDKPVFSKEILCKHSLKFVSPIELEFFKEELLFSRLLLKTSRFSEWNSPHEVLYTLICEAFGRKVNKLPFQEIHRKVSYDELRVLSSAERFLKIREQADAENKLIGAIWKRKGHYPKGFPFIRIVQFSAFISDYDFNYHYVFLSPEDIYTYLIQMFRRKSMFLLKLGLSPLSREFADNIIVNAFVPFIFWFGQKKESEDMVDKAFEVLRLVRPEKNSIVRSWKKTPVKIVNAFDTQAYLTIYNEYCKLKRCSECRIGCNILGK
jgi:hypothetical protein